MKKNKLLIILLALLAFGPTAWAQDLIINSASDWDNFASAVSNGNTFANKTVKLNAEISVSEMIGTSANRFSGTFDGDGHTLTFNKSNTDSNNQYIAPFRYINNATIQNLKVSGTVTSNAKFAGGVVAHAIGSNTITNCVNSTIINATSAPGSNGSHGGILGQLGGSNNSVTISGCLFNGQMQGSSVEYWCGILGYYNSSSSYNNQVTISNCFFEPEEINVKSSNNNYTICRTASVVTNCYYNEEAAEMSQKQGKLARTITGSNDVTVAFVGNPSSNTTMGVIGYGTGIKYGDMLYAGNEEEVSLNLITEPGYAISNVTYTPEGGSATAITPDANGVYSFTMSDANVTINATTQLVAVYREIVGYGDSEESDHWAFIASPVAEGSTIASVTNLVADLAANYDLYRLNPTSVKWENSKNPQHANFTTLVNGQGYLYASKETQTLVFTGEFNTGTSKEIAGLPSGFNLVGNPFTVDAYVNKPYYTLNDEGSAIVAKDSQEDQRIAPCYGVIVEVGENDPVTFTAAQQQSTNNNGGLQVALTQANTRSNTVMDNAIVSFNEGSQLGKFYFGTQNANLYIPQDNEEYAITYSSMQGEMPVNFKANENGNYTITVKPEGVEMTYLHLIDNMTGADVDLLASSGDAMPCVSTYTFTAKTTDYESRFKLVFACGNANGDNETFAFYTNGNWIIANEGEATLQVIDINGRILSSETINGSVSKGINQPTGMYVLRLIKGENVKTQKVVVR